MSQFLFILVFCLNLFFSGSSHATTGETRNTITLGPLPTAASIKDLRASCTATLEFVDSSVTDLLNRNARLGLFRDNKSPPQMPSAINFSGTVPPRNRIEDFQINFSTVKGLVDGLIQQAINAKVFGKAWLNGQRDSLALSPRSPLTPWEKALLFYWLDLALGGTESSSIFTHSTKITRSRDSRYTVIVATTHMGGSSLAIIIDTDPRTCGAVYEARLSDQQLEDARNESNPGVQLEGALTPLFGFSSSAPIEATSE